jgi:hypothetical protein
MQRIRYPIVSQIIIGSFLIVFRENPLSVGNQDKLFRTLKVKQRNSIYDLVCKQYLAVLFYQSNLRADIDKRFSNVLLGKI